MASPSQVNTNDTSSSVPSGSKSSWTSFLKSIASFNGDLSSMTAPAFILSTTSLTEFSAYWAEHPQLLVAPANEPDPQKRSLLVLQWFLSTLRQQYSSRHEKLGSEKKPLNPFLGELFLGHWDNKEVGRTELVSEQVSHHPPATAYCIWNAQHGVRLQGYNAQKASFSGRTIHVKQLGRAVLRLEKYNEDYVFTLPNLHIEGLLLGSPYVELNGHSYIMSSSGFVSQIDYSGKGWLGGKKNSFSAVMHPAGAGNEKKNPLYTVEGVWTDHFVTKDATKKLGSTISTINHRDLSKTPLTVLPIEQQDPLESRRAWAKVAQAIQKGDMDTTSHEKSKIETGQREMRKVEQSKGTTWTRRYFSEAKDDEMYDKLTKGSGLLGVDRLEPEKTGGVWNWDESKHQLVQEGKCPTKGVTPTGEPAAP